jgi:hypothetical protein
LFQTLSLSIFFFSNKKKKKKKTREKKRNVEKGGNFPSSSYFAFHFWVPLLPSHFYPFVSNAFSWHLFFLKQKKTKKP